MRRVDYINQEPVMCFPTPVLDFNIIKQDKIEFSKGDFVYFKDKSIVPVSTYFYKYKENLLILDIDREIPIAHIIKNSKVCKTLNLSELKKEDFINIEQVLDIHGKEIKIKTFSEIEIFYKDFLKYKNSRNDLYKNTRLKLQELIKSSERMRKLDKVAGTSKVVDFINKENFKIIRSKLIHICDNRDEDVDTYKQELIKFNNLNSFIIITNILEKEFYEDFRSKNKEHAALLATANKETDILSTNFNKVWFVEDIYSKEKKLGALFDCFNEMICAKKYSKEEVDFVECLIVKHLNADNELLDSFIDWVDLCPIDKKEMRDTLEEMVNEWRSRDLINKQQI